MNNFHFNLKNSFIFIIILIAIGAGLRLINISEEEFWYDEILSLTVSYYTDSIKDIILYTREFYHPPLFYLIMRWWMFFFGYTEVSTRFFALIFSVLIIPSIYYFGKKLFNNHQVGLMAALFAAVSPLAVEYGQEARPYSLLAFLALWSFYFFWRFLTTSRRRHLFWASILNLIGLYIHFDFFIPLVSQLLIVFILKIIASRNPHYFRNQLELWRDYSVFCGATFLLFLPWLLYSFIPNITGVAYALKKSAPLITRIIFEGDFWFNISDSQERLQAVLVFIGHIAFGVALFFLFRNFFHKYKQQDKVYEMGSVIFIFLWYAISIFVYLISPLSSMYTPKWQRHIIFFSAPLYLMLSYGLTLIKVKWFQFAVLSGILISMAIPLIMVTRNDSEWSFGHKNKEYLAYIAENEERGDLIFIPGTLWESLALYYYPGITPISSFLPLRGYNSITTRENYFLPALLEARYKYKRVPEDDYVGIEELDQLTKPYKRVWLLFGNQTSPVLHWFIANWRFINCPEPFCPQVYLFENPKINPN